MIDARRRRAWVIVAAALKAVHTARYPAANVRTHEGDAAGRPRAIRAYTRIIGAAVGNIIATIITAHIMKVRPRSTIGCGIGAASRATTPPKSAGAIGILTRYSQASKVTAKSSVTT
jgi:hypothetical protein